jgi:molybdenum cofactor cytidylyltransferase
MQGILLAAGFGRRFQKGVETEQDKLLANLPERHKSILWHSATALVTALPHSIAVIQPQQLERKKLLQDLGFVIVESVNAAHGMGYAIADAVLASRNASGWLIALADMPWVTSTLIQQVSTKIVRPESVAAPRFHGKRGQPVAFGAAWYAHLSVLQGDTGAREILKSASIDWVDWHDDSIHRDVDTQQDITQI